MKKSTLIAAIILLVAWGTKAQNTVKKTPADLAWEAMPQMNLDSLNKFKDDVSGKVGQEIYSEHIKTQYLEAGLKFWQKFPKDERVVDWFKRMNDSMTPKFWRDVDEGAKAASISQFYQIPVDLEAYKAWEKKRLKIRAAIMSDSRVPAWVKQNIREAELFRIVYVVPTNRAFIESKKLYLESVSKCFIEAFSYLKTDGDYSNVKRNISALSLYSEDLGLNNDDLTAFYMQFKNSENAEIKNWASQNLNLMALQTTPFELKHHTIEGGEVDLANLRGRVILLDFWSTSCSVCIERMPAIKQVYDKYKSKGFVVISAAYNPNMDKERILAIHHKIGADWPLMIIGGDGEKLGMVAPNSLGAKIWNKYGFSYVPQLLLLNKEGKMVVHNSLLLNGDFDALVERLLNEEYSPKASTSGLKPSTTSDLDPYGPSYFKHDEGYKDFMKKIQPRFSAAYEEFKNKMGSLTGKDSMADWMEALKECKGMDSLKMSLAYSAYQGATQTYIKETILWICKHPNSLWTAQLIMMWWPGDDYEFAYNLLSRDVKNSHYGVELKNAIEQLNKPK